MYRLILNREQRRPFVLRFRPQSDHLLRITPLLLNGKNNSRYLCGSRPLKGAALLVAPRWLHPAKWGTRPEGGQLRLSYGGEGRSSSGVCGVLPLTKGAILGVAKPMPEESQTPRKDTSEHDKVPRMTPLSGWLRGVFFLSLVFKVSLFSLSFAIVRERAPESHSARSVCHLRRRRPWTGLLEQKLRGEKAEGRLRR